MCRCQPAVRNHADITAALGNSKLLLELAFLHSIARKPSRLAGQCNVGPLRPSRCLESLVDSRLRSFEIEVLWKRKSDLLLLVGVGARVRRLARFGTLVPLPLPACSIAASSGALRKNLARVQRTVWPRCGWSDTFSPEPRRPSIRGSAVRGRPVRRVVGRVVSARAREHQVTHVMTRSIRGVMPSSRVRSSRCRLLYMAGLLHTGRSPPFAPYEHTGVSSATIIPHWPAMG